MKEPNINGRVHIKWAIYGKQLFLVVVCYYVQDEDFRARPRLDIIQPLAENCEEISSDALTVRNYQDNECRDYRLGETIKTAL